MESILSTLLILVRILHTVIFISSLLGLVNISLHSITFLVYCYLSYEQNPNAFLKDLLSSLRNIQSIPKSLYVKIEHLLILLSSHYSQVTRKQNIRRIGNAWLINFEQAGNKYTVCVPSDSTKKSAVPSDKVFLIRTLPDNCQEFIDITHYPGTSYLCKHRDFGYNSRLVTKNEKGELVDFSFE